MWRVQLILDPVESSPTKEKRKRNRCNKDRTQKTTDLSLRRKPRETQIPIRGNQQKKEYKGGILLGPWSYRWVEWRRWRACQRLRHWRRAWRWAIRRWQQAWASSRLPLIDGEVGTRAQRIKRERRGGGGESTKERAFSCWEPNERSVCSQLFI